MNLFTQDTENQEVTEINSSNTSGITTDNQVVTELNDNRQQYLNKKMLLFQKKKTLKLDSTKFTVKGMYDYNDDLKIFQINSYYREYKQTYSYSVNLYRGTIGMNIEIFGNKYIHLYTFDMLNNRTTSKIAYSDITIIK
tara:strand:+ start:298 stop:714 length:417 start_codon:yes stop_codon:yes gene_type:complete